MKEEIRIDKKQTWEDCARMYHGLWISANKDAEKWQVFSELIKEEHEEKWSHSVHGVRR